MVTNTPDSALNGDNLMKTVRALADEIGPRPPGTPAEAEARDYLKKRLADAGFDEPESLPFMSWQTWGWNVIPGVSLALIANLAGWFDAWIVWIGVFLSIAAFIELYNGLASRLQIFQPLYPKGESATLVTRIAPSDTVRRTVVLIGHTDSNKARPSFGDGMKKLFLQSGTLLFISMISNIVALTLLAIPILPSAGQVIQVVTALVLAYALFTFIRDEMVEFVDGANDNASAVACTLGTGIDLLSNPLKHTEVWLAFTGAEEVGLLGLRELLDQHGMALKDAYFIDYELVGAGDIFYVTHHSGFAYGTGYTPDADSLRVAEQAKQNRPELNVQGRRVAINEEVRALRQRGYRGICLVGLDEEGWLANWHQLSDNSRNIDPASLERAARFSREMLNVIDREADSDS